MKNTYLGYLLTILSALAFTSTSLFIKLAFGAGMSVWSYSLINSVMTLALLGIMLLREQRPATGRPRIHWGWTALFTASGAGAALAFNVALVYLSISLSTILLFTYPAFVALGAWLLLGQRPSLYHTLALALTLAGAVLTTNLPEVASGAVSLVGVGLAVLAALSHSLYIVTGEKIAGVMSAISATTLTRVGILVGTIMLAPRVFSEIPNVTWKGWLICLISSTVAGVAPFLFLNRGIALIGANRAAIASVAELPFALALGLLFQGDVFLPLQWAGAALIVAAVIISQQQAGPKEESPYGSGTGAT